DRPIRIEWHRLYQQTIETQQPTYDLSGEYRRMLQAEPQNPALQYLLGRTLDDREQAVAMFRQAAASSPPYAYALYALAYDQMSEAHFQKALEYVRQARANDERNIVFRFAEIEALEALGQYDEAVELVRAV